MLTGEGGVNTTDDYILLHLDGDIIDYGRNNFEMTGYSNTFVPGKFGEAAQGWLIFPDRIYDFLLGDYTVDFWWKFQGKNGIDFCLGLGSNSGMLYSAMRIQCYDGLVVFIEYNSGNSHGDKIEIFNCFSDKQWHHVAVTKKDDMVMAFVDGRKVGERYSNMTVLGSDRIHGEIHDNAPECYDEIRIVDRAVWTSNFTPPSEPYN